MTNAAVSLEIPEHFAELVERMGSRLIATGHRFRHAEFDLTNDKPSMAPTHLQSLIADLKCLEDHSRIWRGSRIEFEAFLHSIGQPTEDPSAKIVTCSQCGNHRPSSYDNVACDRYVGDHPNEHPCAGVYELAPLAILDEVEANGR